MESLIRRGRGAVQLVLACVSLGIGIAPAQAHPALLMPPALLQSITFLLGSSSFCVTYTYDQNGNRLTQVTAGLPTTNPLWGSATFGCYLWTP